MARAAAAGSLDRRASMGCECTEMFQALSDATRLRILELLKSEEELCVTEIASHFDIKQPSVSHHLDVLRRAGLVSGEKRGREVYYRFNRDAILDCCGNQFRVFDLELRAREEGRGARLVTGEGRDVVSARDDTDAE